MGGGLAFLNKKSWHTGGGRMIAEVWQREQEAAHEERRLEEMKKEIAEERKLQELQMQAAEAGHIDKVERLEFMYKGGPMMSAAEKTQEEEAYLLGEKKYQAPAEEDEFAKAAAAPGALLADGPGARNETWNKLNADPLLMMRMQEQEARKHVMHNPVKMAQIQKEVAELRVKKKAKKEAKKEAKREMKEERKRAIREEMRRKVLGKEGYAAAKLREQREGEKSQSKSKSGPGVGSRARGADVRGDRRDGKDGRSDDSSESGSPVRRGRPHSRSRSRSPPRRAGAGGVGEEGLRDEGGAGHGHGHGQRQHQRQRPLHCSGGGSDGAEYVARRRGDDREGERRGREGGGHSRSRSRSHSRSRDRRDRRDRDQDRRGRFGGDDDRRDDRDRTHGVHPRSPRDDAPRRDGLSERGDQHHRQHHQERQQERQQRVGGGDHRGGDKATGVRDGASAQDGAKGYGLTYANQRAEAAAVVRRENRNEWRESTKGEREAAEEAARRAKEAAWAKTGGKNSVGHRTGKLTAEAKAARLRAMMSDADVHDEARWSRLQKSAEEEAAGGEKSLVELSVGAPGRHHSEAAPFLEVAQRKAFGGGEVGEGGGLEDRIGVRKYYAQRGIDGNAYKR